MAGFPVSKRLCPLSCQSVKATRMTNRPEQIAAADAEARRIAHGLLRLGHAALAYTDPATGTPGISRIAFGLSPQGQPMTLISALAAHFAGLRAHPSCALMLGDPPDRGDPLVHPRLMIPATASFVAPDAPDRPALRDHWLATHPKSRLYIDFADFALVLFTPGKALLNAGFGRAHHLEPHDLRP